MSGLGELLARVVAGLEAAGIPFMIAGSFASTAHGLPRTTQDLDIVIDPEHDRALDTFLAALSGADHYVDVDAAREALRRRSMFNLVDHASGWKIDFIVRKDRPFSIAELGRRVPSLLLGVPVFLASAEDTIVSKLEWSSMGGGSERQRRDVAGILMSMGGALDRPYVERWVDELGLREEWVLAQAVTSA